MSELLLRRATIEDVDIYYAWATDPDVRQQSFSGGEITYDDHVAWFSGRLADPGCELLVFVEDGRPIGQIRFTVDDDACAELGYSIAREARGRGLACRLVELGVAAMTGRGLKMIVAKVKSNNQPSLNVFVRCGFEEGQAHEHRLFYKRLVDEKGSSDGLAAV